MISPERAEEMVGEEEYRRRVTQERRLPGEGGTLLVGERANNREVPNRSTDPEYRIRVGGFLWGPSRDRLTGLGLRWDAAMNLLPSVAVSDGPRWDRELADAVALNTSMLAIARRWRLVLLGAKVAAAFGASYEPLAIGQLHGVETLVLPHPSGMCRWWNEKANLDAARGLFARLEEPWDTLG